MVHQRHQEAGDRIPYRHPRKAGAGQAHREVLPIHQVHPELLVPLRLAVTRLREVRRHQEAQDQVRRERTCQIPGIQVEVADPHRRLRSLHRLPLRAVVEPHREAGTRGHIPASQTSRWDRQDTAVLVCRQAHYRLERLELRRPGVIPVVRRLLGEGHRQEVRRLAVHPVVVYRAAAPDRAGEA